MNWNNICDLSNFYYTKVTTTCLLKMKQPHQKAVCFLFLLQEMHIFLRLDHRKRYYFCCYFCFCRVVHWLNLYRKNCALDTKFMRCIMWCFVSVWCVSIYKQYFYADRNECKKHDIQKLVYSMQFTRRALWCLRNLHNNFQYAHNCTLPPTVTINKEHFKRHIQFTWCCLSIWP